MNLPPTADPNQGGAPQPSTLAPEALAGLGKLRECVAAAKNLEHLVASRDVGPKVLQQLVPDVATELEPFSKAVADIYSFVQGELRLPAHSLSSLVNSAQQTTGRLVEALRSEPGVSFNARRRLAVERNIRESLPPLAATLSQMELLVEATASTGVAMSIEEMLTSAPDGGSNRPHRKIIVVGDITSPIVTVPARIGVRCLGMLASSLGADSKVDIRLHVSHAEGQHLLCFSGEGQGPETDAEIPVYPHTPYSLETVAAALGRYGGKLNGDQSGFTLPAG